MGEVHIGTAAWNIPNSLKTEFPKGPSRLESYSRRFNAVEINTSFYKDHKARTYERWYSAVPENFKFSVKLSRAFTHEDRLKYCDQRLKESLSPLLTLKEKFAVLLIQLPPSLNFVHTDAVDFFGCLREHYEGPVALEPRHFTWNDPVEREVLRKFQISRVIADPAPIKTELKSAEKLIYYRLHGSPEIYKSNYTLAQLKSYARRISEQRSLIENIWCIFDNTTYGYATANALALQKVLSHASQRVQV